MKVIEEYKRRVRNVLEFDEYRQCDSAGTRNELIARLTCPLKSIRLYQYRSCENYDLKVADGLYESLKAGTLRFKSPLQFNDPYDSLLYYNEKRLFEYFNKDPYRSVLKKIGLENVKLIADRIRNCLRVSCFSEVNDSPIMWSHYANNGNGFCLCYEFHPSFQERLCLKDAQSCVLNKENTCKVDCESCAELSLFPVIYRRNRYDATDLMCHEIEYIVAQCLNQTDMLDTTRYDMLEAYKIALFKSKDWCYEREWRLVLSGIETFSLKPYECQCLNLKGVVIGQRVNAKNAEAITRAVDDYRKLSAQEIWLKGVEVDVNWSKYRLRIIEKDKWN